MAAIKDCTTRVIYVKANTCHVKQVTNLQMLFSQEHNVKGAERAFNLCSDLSLKLGIQENKI